MNNRILSWDGCKNVRDLGGLRTGDGRATRFGAIIRSDTPSRLSAAGWSALHDYGVRTIITLRTHGMTEDELDVTPPYDDIVTVQAPIEDVTDKEFVQRWASTDFWSTPLYYTDALQRWPERHAAVMTAIAQAGPGGILFHCVRGHDRTGIITLLLLSLAGVTPEDILADYVLSLDPEREELLAQRNTTTPAVIFDVLDSLNPVEEYLQKGGVSPRDLDTVRQRLAG